MEKGKNSLFWHRYIDDLYTVEDVRKLQKMSRDALNGDLLDGLTQEVWEEAGQVPSCTGVECERYKEDARQLLRRINSKKKVRYYRLAMSWVGIAVMVCLIWGVVSYWHSTMKPEVTWQVAVTSYGEQKEVNLPDGTLLILNACSQVRYPNRFAGEKRGITLEGEAYFQVAHHEEQPFVVATKAFDVQVLGTCFNVRAYSSDETVSVDVESGKVQVNMPEAMMRLNANEQILINKLSGEYSKQHDERDVAVWRNGGLRFDATPIRDVAKVLERRYNCRITFADGQQFDNLISGEHDNQSLEAVLQSIEYTSGIHYRLTGNLVLLYKKG